VFTGGVASVRAVVQTLGVLLEGRFNNIIFSVCCRKLGKEVLERFNFVSRC
jgi:hypothetical protein